MTLVLAGATANVVRMIVKWLANGGGLFVETRALVLSSTLAVLGLQIISTMLFLSLFADRLRRSMKTATLVHGHILPLGETQH